MPTSSPRRATWRNGNRRSPDKPASGARSPRPITPSSRGSVPPKLRTIARTFYRLQEARHAADYDLTRTLTRRETVDLVNSAKQAMTDWNAVKGSVEADTFLVALLVQRKAKR